MASRNPNDRLVSSLASVPVSKRSRGATSPVLMGMAHQGAYLCGSRDPSVAVVSGHYGLPVPPSGYDPMFHVQPYIQAAGEQRYRASDLQHPHRPPVLTSFQPSDQLDRDSLRSVYLPPQQPPQPSHLPHSSGSLPPRHHHPALYHSQQQQSMCPTPVGGTGLLGGAGTHPGPSASASMYGLPPGPMPYKRQAMMHADATGPPIPARRDVLVPLKIDTDLKKEETSGSYNPQVEAISPTLPCDEMRDGIKQSKEELLQNINRVDREIAKVEQTLTKLQVKQQQLEKEVKKSPEERIATPDNLTDLRHQSLAQIIYEENRHKASVSHMSLSKLGKATLLPLYYQPSDAPALQDTLKHFSSFKKQLIVFLKKRHQASRIRERYLAGRYEQLIQSWTKRMDRLENSAKKRAKDAKIRDCFEKIFPELKKQREDKEKLLGRVSTSGSRLPGYAHSEATIEQIADGLHEQEEVEKKRFSLAVIPPMMLDARQRSLRYCNENGLLTDPLQLHNENMMKVQYWTPVERETFKEKYLVHPKNFGYIASAIENKSTQDCVLFYYLSKMSANYKQLIRRNITKRRKFQKKPEKTDDNDEAASSTSGVTEDKKTQSVNSQSVVVNIMSTVAVTNTTTTSDASSVPDVPNGSTVDQTAADIPTVVQVDGGDDAEMSEGKAHVESADDRSKSDNGGATVHECALCHNIVEHQSLSRPLTKSNCELYGIDTSNLLADMRVCNSCRCKFIHKRYIQCQVPSCKSSRRKVRSLRALPAKLNELPPETKSAIMKELQLTTDTVRCCTSCFNRVTRMLNNPQSNESADQDDEAESLKWSDSEVELLKQALRQNGRNWSAVSSLVSTKDEAECKRFYLSCRQKFSLDTLVAEHSGEVAGSAEATAKVVTSEEDEMASDDDAAESEEDVLEQLRPDSEANAEVSTVPESSPRPAHDEQQMSNTDNVTGATLEQRDNNSSFCAEPGAAAAAAAAVISSRAGTPVSCNNSENVVTVAEGNGLEIQPAVDKVESKSNVTTVDLNDLNSAEPNRQLEESESPSDCHNMSCVRDLINSAIEKTLQDPLQGEQTISGSVTKLPVSAPSRNHSFLLGRDGFSSSPHTDGAVQYSEAASTQEVAEDLSQHTSNSTDPAPGVTFLPQAPCPRVASGNSVGTVAPPPAHCHHGKGGIIERHTVSDQPYHQVAGSSYMLDRTRESSPANDRAWPLPSPPGLPPNAPYMSVLHSGNMVSSSLPKKAVATRGPPPLIHEPPKTVLGSIVLGTPVVSQRRRQYHQQPSPSMMQPGPAADQRGLGRQAYDIGQPNPYAQFGPNDEQMALARHRGGQWADAAEPIGHSSVDINVSSGSRDLLLGDFLTAQQMYRPHLAASATRDSYPDRRRLSPHVAPYLPPPGMPARAPWPYRNPGMPDPPLACLSSPNQSHRGDIPGGGGFWPPRMDSGAPCYSVCGEPSRQSRTPPLIIQKTSLHNSPTNVQHMVDRSPVHDSHQRSKRTVEADWPQGTAVDQSGRGSVTRTHMVNDARLQNSNPHSMPGSREQMTSVASHNHGMTGGNNMDGEQLTAATLINAIIIDQINKDAQNTNLPSGADSRCSSTSGIQAPVTLNVLDRLGVETSSSRVCVSPRSVESEHGGRLSRSGGLTPSLMSRSPRQVDASPNSAASKKLITLGEHIDSIILHDYTRTESSDVISAAPMGRANLRAYVNDYMSDNDDGFRGDGKDVEFDELARKSRIWATGCPSPRASTDALLPSFSQSSSVILPEDGGHSSRKPHFGWPIEHKLMPSQSLPHPRSSPQISSRAKDRRDDMETMSDHMSPGAARRMSPYGQRESGGPIGVLSGSAHTPPVARRRLYNESPGGVHYQDIPGDKLAYDDLSSQTTQEYERDKDGSNDVKPTILGSNSTNRSWRSFASHVGSSSSSSAMFDVARSPVPFVANEREVLRLSAGSVDSLPMVSKRQHDSDVPTRRLVKSASPAGGGGARHHANLTSCTTSPVATRHGLSPLESQHPAAGRVLSVQPDNMTDRLRSQDMYGRGMSLYTPSSAEGHITALDVIHKHMNKELVNAYGLHTRSPVTSQKLADDTMENVYSDPSTMRRVHGAGDGAPGASAEGPIPLRRLPAGMHSPMPCKKRARYEAVAAAAADSQACLGRDYSTGPVYQEDASGPFIARTAIQRAGDGKPLLERNSEIASEQSSNISCPSGAPAADNSLMKHDDTLERMHLPDVEHYHGTAE